MAEYRHYVCECGYGVSCNPAGFDAMMSGVWVTMRCAKCNEIVHINANDLCHFDHACPNCGEREGLSVWNPVDCSCPKCGKKMTAEEGEYYLAD